MMGWFRFPPTFQATGVGRTVVRVEEDLTAFLRTQQVLGADVHVHHHQLIRDARPIPPAGSDGVPSARGAARRGMSPRRAVSMAGLVSRRRTSHCSASSLAHRDRERRSGVTGLYGPGLAPGG